MWERYGEFLSILPVPHEHYAKESPAFCASNNLNNVAHLYDGKDTIIETVRNDDNLT